MKDKKISHRNRSFVQQLVFMCIIMLISAGCEKDNALPEAADSITRSFTIARLAHFCNESSTSFDYVLYAERVHRPWHPYLYYPENLPDEYRVYGILVEATYRFTGERTEYCKLPIVDIIKIKKIGQ